MPLSLVLLESSEKKRHHLVVKGTPNINLNKQLIPALKKRSFHLDQEKDNRIISLLFVESPNVFFFFISLQIFLYEGLADL